jgi:hypothetical protein
VCENDSWCDCGSCLGGRCMPPADSAYCQLAVP